ncbi:MAG TPA: F0F1 ATP synthase subunit B [Thermoanaerobaculia bacterium]|nr:F0F1 ATP synthase subunit B [Thermoanaerobaculia bacterium]
MLRKAKVFFILLAAAALATPAIPAIAAEAEGQSNNLFAGDVGNVVWTLVIFGLVLFVLGKFAWGPILKALQGREDFIRESLEKAKHDREEAEARLKEYLDKINASRAEATAIVEEGRRDAEIVKRRIESEARAESEKIVARGKHEIEIATETAIKELYTASANLATELAARVIGRELKPEDHERLIAQAIADLDRARETAAGEMPH